MHRGPPSPPPRPIHPIIPPALYDQSILFYTASHETSRPYGSTVLSILLSSSCNRRCTRSLSSFHTASCSHRIPSPESSPGFSFSIEPPPSPIPLLTSQFPRLSFPPTQPIGANVSFHFVRSFLPASSFFSSLCFLFFFFSFTSFLSNHPLSLSFFFCSSFVSLIDKSPYTMRFRED